MRTEWRGVHQNDLSRDVGISFKARKRDPAPSRQSRLATGLGTGRSSWCWTVYGVSCRGGSSPQPPIPACHRAGHRAFVLVLDRVRSQLSGRQQLPTVWGFQRTDGTASGSWRAAGALAADLAGQPDTHGLGIPTDGRHRLGFLAGGRRLGGRLGRPARYTVTPSNLQRWSSVRAPGPASPSIPGGQHRRRRHRHPVQSTALVVRPCTRSS